MTNAALVSAATRILIIDDHPLVRDGLRQVIHAEPDLVACGEASGAAEAIVVAEQTQPDLAIVDLQLAEGHGLDLIVDFRHRFYVMRIVVLSLHDESVYAEPALRAGASGYVNKQASVETIIEAIRLVLRGEVYASPSTIDLQSVHAGESPEAQPHDRLSSRELQVFDLLGQGLTTAQIAGKLLLSPKTIGTYCDGIRSKLHFTNSAEMRYHAVQQRTGLK